MTSSPDRPVVAEIERWVVGTAIAAALLLALALRAWRIDADPLWLDEAYSAYAADHGFAFLWRVVPAYETHPPFYYSLLRLWSLATGDTLLARRMLGLIAGTAAVPLAAFAARELGGLVGWSRGRTVWLVALATTLVAVQPHLVMMTRQVRPYPVMIAVYAFALWAVLRLGRDAEAGRPLHRAWLVGFLAAEAAMLWLHSLGPLFGASLALALLAMAARPGLSRRDWIALALSQVVAGLLYLPALLIMLGQAPTWIASTWLRFSWRPVPGELSYLYLDWHRWTPTLGLLGAACGVVLLVRAGSAGARAAAALVVLAALPTLASIVLSATVAPVFITRTLGAVTTPALLLVAAGFCWPGRWRWAALPVAGWIALTAAVITVQLLARPPAQDWYRALDWLKPRMRAGDVVWAYPNEGALPLAYAAGDRRRPLAIVPIPAAVPAFGRGGYFPTGSRGVVSLYPPQIAALMRTPAARRPPTIWLMRLGAWKYDPGDGLLGALETDRTVVGRFRQRQIDIVGLRLPAPQRR